MVNTAPEAHLHGFRGCFVVVPLWWRSPLARIEKCLLSSFGEWLVPVWFPIRMQMAEPRNGLRKLLALSGLRCWCADFSVAERGKTMAKILEICLLGCFCGLRNVPVWRYDMCRLAFQYGLFCNAERRVLHQGGCFVEPKRAAGRSLVSILPVCGDAFFGTFSLHFRCGFQIGIFAAVAPRHSAVGVACKPCLRCFKRK